MSKKSEKYLSKYGERNYAPKVRKIEKSDLAEYSNRSQCWQTSEASCSNSIQQSRQEQEETLEEILDKTYHKGENNEKFREEDVDQTYQQGQQRIQDAAERGRAIEENNIKTKEEKMKKQTVKEKKHEAKETKAYEKVEDKKEKKEKKK